MKISVVINKSVVVGSVFALATAGCQCRSPSRTEQVLTASTAFAAALELFALAKEAYATSVRDAVGPTIAELNTPAKSELTGIAASWEIRWLDAEKKAHKLQERFNVVTGSAERYFEELNEVSASISDPELLEAERGRNDGARKGWDDAYADSFQTMKKLERLRKRGHDIHSILLGAAMRDQISVHVRELRAISHDAEQLIKELDRLVSQGQDLLT